MNVCLVSHYFPPEVGAPQARLSEFASAWSDAGRHVTVVTGFPNHPTGRVPDRYRRRLIAAERRDGYRIVRSWLYATPNQGFLRKVLGHLSFMVSAIILGLPRLGRSDVVVVSSPTFFSIFAGWVIARAKKAKLIVEIRDLWPAIFVELGVLTNHRVIRVLERLELAAYRAADHVVVVSEGFKDHIAERGIARSKISTIRNGVDLARFSPEEPRRSQVRDRLGARSDEDVVALYIGAHGISHALPSIADAAARICDPRIRFAFVGEGAAKGDLRRRIEELGLDDRVVMLPGVDRDEVPGILAAADICLAPLRDVPLFQTFIPSKIFEYLSSGKAVIGALRGEPATILEEAGASVVEPEDAEAMAAAVAALANDEEQRERMGRHGRAYVEEEFDRRQLAERYLDIMDRLVEEK